MFTGIVRALCPVTSIRRKPELLSFSVDLGEELSRNLDLGASVALDGVCMTVTQIDGAEVSFDAIMETLGRTTLGSLEEGRLLNVERSLCIGDEIGGHHVSGHVDGMAEIKHFQRDGDLCVLHLACPSAWMDCILEKGFIAIDGASLTVVDVDAAGIFTVHLIPETLSRTTLGRKGVGDRVNIELDKQTQAIVTTVTRYLARQNRMSGAPDTPVQSVGKP